MKHSAQYPILLRSHVWSLQAEFMHNPACFDPIRSSVLVEHQRLPHPHDFACHRIVHRSILPRSFPVSRCRGTIGSEPGCILAVPKAEEVPLTGIELGHIRKLPWLTSVQVNLDQSALQALLIGDLLVQIVTHQLLITWVKPKPRRQCCSNVSQPH